MSSAPNRAGESARRKAREAREAAPIRSFLGRVLGVYTQERAWRRGAKGEDLVAAQLARLPRDSWRVIHDISLDAVGHNVDHLVIGPGGVFTLNSKHLSGKAWVAERAFLVNGKRTDYLHKARWEAREVATRLAGAGVQVEVRPVIVVIAQGLTIRAQPVDVSVVARREISRWLEHQPVRLAPEEVERLAAFV